MTSKSGSEGLYVRRNLIPASAADLTAWAKAQGFVNLVPEHELHATIVYSRTPVWLRPESGTVVAESKPRSVAPLGDKGAIVLYFDAPELDKRFEEARTAGASSDHGTYRSHITITYDISNVDLGKVEPYKGSLVLGPEIHEPLNESWAKQKGLIAESVTLRAMALNVPATPGHPNKLPFKGVLTRLDEVSDSAPAGSNGRRVIMTRAAAEVALPTLLGMAVNLQGNMGGHAPRLKVGLIEKAEIIGDAIHIEGFLYAADFPKEVRQIQSERDDLGFSWEIQNIYVEDVKADPLVITGCMFTGAAILYKDKAAYQSTSLAAEAEEIFMTKEVLDAIAALSTQVGTMTTRIEKIEAGQAESLKELQAGKEQMAKVEPLAASLEASADALETAGVGKDARRGHVKALRAMAEHIRTTASTGKLADVWPGLDGFYASTDNATKKSDEETPVEKELKAQLKAQADEVKATKDSLASVNTKIDDIKASAAKASPAPERKTLNPQITALLARASISLPEGEKKLNVGEVNKLLAGCSLDTTQRMEVKAGLERAGLLAA